MTTNLHTKFMLQAQKQWEDSAMILASNKQQNKTERETEAEKKRVNKADTEQTTGKNKWEQHKTLQARLYEILNQVMQLGGISSALKVNQWINNEFQSK